jgi:hypothetical protein
VTHLEAVIEVIISPNKLLSLPATQTIVMILLYVVYAALALYDIYLDNHDPYPRTQYEGFANVVFILGILLPMTLMSRDNPRTTGYRPWLRVVQIDCLLICIALVGYGVYSRLVLH